MTDTTILGGLDPELVDRVVSRRDALRETGRRAGLLAVASMPVLFGVMAKKAFAQGGIPADIITVLNFALTLEYLEADFYQTGLPTVDVGEARPIFEQIRNHEVAHVALLEGLLGENAIVKPTFDFTAGGAFNDVFSNPGTFITVAQALEDTGVRAYKGQAAALIAEDQVLTTALRIHSVEARHAAAIRRLSQSPAAKAWITGNDGAPTALAPVYAGEENTTQLGIDLLPFGSADRVSEAFDEPLTRAEVLAIVVPFGVPPDPE
ncbi:MAG TPA: ferritin-like domain-containing protein [Gemmatimonadales bacterium]|nr:ferritin-like domain-containing protein [Gemmatimonadales bacterium]